MNVGGAVGRFLTWRAGVRAGQVAILRLYGPVTGGARSADWSESIRRLRDSAIFLAEDDGGQRETISAHRVGSSSRSALKTTWTSGIPDRGPCRNTAGSGSGVGIGLVWTQQSR